MIKPLNVELKILVYIIIYGIYYFAVSDLLVYIIEHKKRKKFSKVLIEILYLLSQIYITYDFCYKLDGGYIPVYFLLFIIIGFLLYYLFMREYFIKCLDFANKLIIKIKPYFVHLFYSTTLCKIKLKNIFKKRKKRNQNTWHDIRYLV